MNVSTAIVCVNCDYLFEYGASCPACNATQQLIPLSHWLPAVHKPVMHKKVKKEKRVVPKVAYAIFGGIFAEVTLCLLLMLR